MLSRNFSTSKPFWKGSLERIYLKKLSACLSVERENWAFGEQWCEPDWTLSKAKKPPVNFCDHSCQCGWLLACIVLYLVYFVIWCWCLLYFLFAGDALAPSPLWWAGFVKRNRGVCVFSQGAKFVCGKSNWAVPFQLLHFLPDVGWNAQFYHLLTREREEEEKKKSKHFRQRLSV